MMEFGLADQRMRGKCSGKDYRLDLLSLWSGNQLIGKVGEYHKHCSTAAKDPPTIALCVHST